MLEQNLAVVVLTRNSHQVSLNFLIFCHVTKIDSFNVSFEFHFYTSFEFRVQLTSRGPFLVTSNSRTIVGHDQIQKYLQIHKHQLKLFPSSKFNSLLPYPPSFPVSSFDKYEKIVRCIRPIEKGSRYS